MLKKFKPKEHRAVEEMKNEYYAVLSRIKSDNNLSNSELLKKLEEEIEKLSAKREELDRMDSYYKTTEESNSESQNLRIQNLKELVSVSETLGRLKIAKETLIERENIKTDESGISAIENGSYRKRKNFLSKEELDEVSLEEIHNKTDEMTRALFQSLESDDVAKFNYSSYNSDEHNAKNK